MVTQQQKDSIRFSKLNYFEAFFSSLVVGLAETYFIAYSIHLGVSVIQSGLLASLPFLFAGIAPFLFRKIFHRFLNSSWVLIGSGVQCFALAGLALVGVAAQNDIDAELLFYILLFLYSTYWFGYFAVQPAWNRWVSDYINTEESGYFFAKRLRMVQWGTILGLIVGGSLLHLKILQWPTLVVFVALFITAYHLKLISFIFYFKQPISKHNYELSWQKALHFFKTHRSFFRSYSLFNLSLYLSAPFVSGYLLSFRHITYIDYMIVFAAFFFGKMSINYLLESKKIESFKKISPHAFFFGGGLLAAPLPFFWPLCSEVWMMSLLHFVSGVGWGFWEVGLSLSIFKNVNSHEKIEAVALYHLIGLPTQVIGGVLGALLLRYVLRDNYNMMFYISGLLRLLLVFPLRSKKFGQV